MVEPKRTPARARAAAALAAILALAYVAGVLVPSSHAQAPAVRNLLPDLQAAVPDHVVLAVHKTRAIVGFNSAVLNRGEGPLEVVGQRASRRSPGLAARQIVLRTDGSRASLRDVGALRYVTEPAHRYWHLDDVMRYELRRFDDFSVVRRIMRRGFCLRDNTTFTHFCGRGRPDLLSLREGVGPARTARWAPVSEGQSFDVTNLSAGRYWLVSRADPDGLFLESDDANNASALLVSLDVSTVGRARHVRLTLLGACPGAERCDKPEAFAG